MMNDVPILVGSSKDTLLDAVEEEARRRHKPVLRLSPKQFVSLVSISVNEESISIRPSVPLLLRSEVAQTDTSSFDTLFLQGEEQAVLWAVGFLSPARVVNRPTEVGRVGRLSYSAAVSCLRAAIPDAPPELYTSDREELASGVWAIKDLLTGMTGYSGRDALGAGPFKARATTQSGQYERIIIMGERTWCCAPLVSERLGLARKSLAVCQAQDIDFATVLWELESNHLSAAMVAIHPLPSWGELEPWGSDVADALVKWLYNVE